MTKRLTAEQLEAIRKRAEAASSGPWTYDFDNGFIEAAERIRIAEPFNEDNARFLTEAREDIPALLAEVEHYSGKISLYLDEIERLRRKVISAEMREYGAKHELAEYKAHVDDIERKVLEAIAND